MKSSKRPFLSIVIPTRNRHETLPYAIRTVLEQDFDDYEIIVCDNNSSPETKEAVDKLNSPKIRYIRSDIDLSMADNWNLALSHALGNYITVIADNDGFIDGSLEYIKLFIKNNNQPKLIGLSKNLYYWKSASVFGLENKIGLSKKVGIKYIKGLDAIKDALKLKNGYLNLPMVYSAIVHRSLMKQIKYNGKYINGYVPDVYTGFALAYKSKYFIKIDTPLLIAGYSKKSNGHSSVFGDKNKIFYNFRKFAEQSEIRPHAYTPTACSLNANIYDSFLMAKEIFGIKEIGINRKKILNGMLTDLRCFSKMELKNELAKIEKTCDNKNLVKIFSSINPKEAKPSKIKYRKGFTSGRDIVLIDGNAFNVKNILCASKFMSNFYEYYSLIYPELNRKLNGIEKKANVAIWGNGASSKQLQSLIKLKGKINISYIIDSFVSNPRSMPIVKKPEEIDNKIDYIIIASMYLEEIQKTIKKLKLPKKIKILEYKYVPDNFEWDYSPI